MPCAFNSIRQKESQCSDFEVNLKFCQCALSQHLGLKILRFLVEEILSPLNKTLIFHLLSWKYTCLMSQENEKQEFTC